MDRELRNLRIGFLDRRHPPGYQGALVDSLVPLLAGLDVMLPDLSVWETLRRLREGSAGPVMMLTGRDSGVDKARVLDLGAYDYLTKPFSFV